MSIQEEPESESGEEIPVLYIATDILEKALYKGPKNGTNNKNKLISPFPLKPRTKRTTTRAQKEQTSPGRMECSGRNPEICTRTQTHSQN